MAGDVYVAGGAGTNAIIRKYRDDGSTATLLFGNAYGAGAFNDITAMDGFLFAAGQSGADARMIRIDTAGTQQWSQTYDLGTSNDTINGIIGHNGRLFAVGRNANDAVIFEINPATGLRVGSLTYYNGSGNLEDVFNDVAVDAATGRLYAIGYTTSAATGQDVLVAAYDSSASGNVTWASSNPGISTIAPNGLASAVSPGSTAKRP